MDNRLINIVSQGRKDLKLALALALSSSFEHERQASHYKVLKLKPSAGVNPETKEDPAGTITLILLDGDKEGGQRITDALGMLPFENDSQRLLAFVQDWLKQRRDSEYADDLDHDGSNGKGFRVFTDFWGHVAGHRYAICGIQPIWAWYGK